jgi:hypothetical protein
MQNGNETRKSQKKRGNVTCDVVKIPFKEFSALDAHPGWHLISSNAHHFHTILTKDFDNLMACI